MSEDREPQAEEPEASAPVRHTRETLVGCAGLGLILLTLPLLWLSVSVGATWLSHTLPLLALFSLAAGAILALRVPAGRVARSRDPHQPLTRAGVAPSIERPATRANRVAWGLSALLLAVAVVGYIMELIHPGAALGVTSMLAVGLLLVAQGALVSLNCLPVPALRWLRFSIASRAGGQALVLMAMGCLIVCNALFLALLDGAAWGLLGMSVFIAALALLSPVARRTPTARYPSRSRDQGGAPPL